MALNYIYLNSQDGNDSNKVVNYLVDIVTNYKNIPYNVELEDMTVLIIKCINLV